MCAKFVHYDTESPDVTRAPVGLLLNELRGDIIRRPNHRVSKTHGIQELAHAQVPDFAVFLGIHEDIQCLQVAMENTLPVELGDTQYHLDDELPNSKLRKRLRVLFEV